jgi:hypothetical protein
MDNQWNANPLAQEAAESGARPSEPGAAGVTASNTVASSTVGAPRSNSKLVGRIVGAAAFLVLALPFSIPTIENHFISIPPEHRGEKCEMYDPIYSGQHSTRLFANRIIQIGQWSTNFDCTEARTISFGRIESGQHFDPANPHIGDWRYMSESK